MSRNCKLGDIAELSTGPFGSQLHKSDYVDVGIPVVMPQNINELRNVDHDGIAQIDDSDYQRLSRHALLENDIVFARRGEVDKHAFIGESDLPMLCGTGCLRVRVKDKTVNPHYLSLYLNKPDVKACLRQHAVGSNMPNLNTGILSEIPIDIPDKSEQDSVVDLLGAIDDKIQVNQRICKELENTVSLIYDYWFTQFDFPDENGHPYRSSGGEMHFSKELKRDIPSDWNVADFENISFLSNGINYSKNEMQGYSYPIVNVRDISSSTLFIDSRNLDYIQVDRDTASKYLVTNDDIIIARSGIPGAIRLISSGKRDIVYSGFVIKCTPKNPEFRNYLALSLKKYEGTSATVTGGSILKNVSQETLKRLVFPIPPFAIMRLFNQISSSLFIGIARAQREIGELQALCDWLLPMLMNGQVRASESGIGV